MSGSFNVGGLVSGLDSNNIIRQLLQIERQPVLRIERRINALETQRNAIRDLRTTLQTLRSRAQDFQFTNRFAQFGVTSSEASIATAQVTGSPVTGAFALNVQQLASATVATSSNRLGAAIDPNVALSSSGISTEVTAGDFTINGVAFTIDPATDSLDSILTQINGSAAGVTATYDALTDRVTIENTAAGDTSLINFGPTGDGSNFLAALNITAATQSTNGSGSTTATSTRNLGAINPAAVLNTASFDGGALTAGSFSINGISVSVDPTTDTLNDVLGRINDSAAQVTATYDTATDSIRVVSDTLGSRTVKFTSGTSNFLDVTHLTAATQSAGNDAQFTINGGPVQSRNSNEFADAISGVTLRLLSEGTSTVTVSYDDDAVIEDVQAYLTAFNDAATQIRNVTGSTGALANDNSIRSIESFLRNTIFSDVSGLSGDFNNLLDIGISTGSAFDSQGVAQLELDEDTFREALLEGRANVGQLFSNTNRTGIADQLEDYLDETTGLSGFLNDRVRTGGSIDRRIELYNGQIDRVERRVELLERRLRSQFARLEQLTASFQSQGQSLSGLSSRFTRF